MPVDVIHGNEPLTQDDWGYAPPRLLTGKEVALAADFLALTPFDVLWPHLDPGAMEGIYPGIWREHDAADYLRSWYERQRTFFARAAAMGDALIVYLS